MHAAAACALALASWTTPAASPVVAITDVEIVDVEHDRRTGPRTVVVADGRIIAVTRSRDTRIPVDAQRVDGRGRYLMPGLVDMHVHLFNLSSRRTPNDWTFPLFVANGVTSVREMNADAASLAIVRRWQYEIDAGERVAPRILGAGIAVRGATPDDAVRDVEAAAAAGAAFIKVFSDVPATHWRAIVDAARTRRIPVAGHVPAQVRMTDAAAAGQRSAEHLAQAFEACSSIEARHASSGDAPDALHDAQATVLAAFDRTTCRRVARELAATGMALVPTLVLLDAEAHRVSPPASDPRWRYLRDDERARWTRLLANDTSRGDALASERRRVARDIVGTFHAANVALMPGTDAPMPAVYPGWSLHDELALLVEAGLSPRDALRAATLAPAEFFGIAATAGSVAVGKRADLVLLDADPTRDIGNTRRIAAVVIGGRLLRRADLDALLDNAATPETLRP